ncbi:DUF397 domain-containing protein [Amycolatopsis anabasis]|uniref:DUF397 domain-containing protein n=1 Tax=Amycolatopsis anabasis TaxID=1840409 RepID=UPI00131CAF35|nr:DUF397 domain-containing protein [Amycolatopsis anabasis]
MAAGDTTDLIWRKSSYSTGAGGQECVEVAFRSPSVAVRDSKNPGSGVLSFPPAQWRAFMTRLRVRR